SPAAQVGRQVVVFPSDTGVAPVHPVSLSSQLPSQLRPSYPVIGWPPVLDGAAHVTVATAAPDPRFRSTTPATVAVRPDTRPGGSNAVLSADDAGAAPFPLWAVTR